MWKIVTLWCDLDENVWKLLQYCDVLLPGDTQEYVVEISQIPLPFQVYVIPICDDLMPTAAVKPFSLLPNTGELILQAT